MIMILFLFLQVITSLILLLIIKLISEDMRIKINIYNLPMILISALFIFFTCWLGMAHPIFYFLIGMGFFLYTSKTIGLVENKFQLTNLQKIVMLTCSFLFWNQFIVLIWFFINNENELYAN